MPDSSGLGWESFLVDNVVPVTIGNVVGGALLVSAVYWSSFSGALQAQRRGELRSANRKRADAPSSRPADHGAVFEVRIHGRGGQGVVTAAELLSVAAFAEGKDALAFPTFGSERTGAPVTAFCRVSDRPIRSREPIVEPDALIVQDTTLLHQVDLFGGVGPEAYVLINTGRGLDELGLDDFAESRFQPERVVTVAATDLAREHLGRPLPNAALLGGFAALTGVVSVESVANAIRGRFSGRTGEGNVAAAIAAADAVRERRTVRA